MARLAAVLSEAERAGTEMASSVAAIRLLIFSGCRLSEILTLRWEHVDLERRCLRLPDSKTGAKVVHLNGAAIDVLALLARDPRAGCCPAARRARIWSTCKSPGDGSDGEPTWAISGCMICGTASPRWPPGSAKGCT